jgi:hypothetical protein
VTLFRRSTLMRGQERTGRPAPAERRSRRYNGAVSTTGEGDDGGSGREELAGQAKVVLVVWGTVTLMLVITYAVVLVLL